MFDKKIFRSDMLRCASLSVPRKQYPQAING